MQYLTELHAHTSEVSPCAHITAKELVDRYIEAGYSTLYITNHYHAHIIDSAGATWEEKIAHYLSAYHIAKEYAGDRLHILWGCELRFAENHNDYLVYGLTEEFLKANPDLHCMSLKTFSSFARENGLLLIQAHPFRKGMVIMRPEYLDGIEVFNGHKGHDSRNKIADMWARRYGLLRTSGSDFHNPDSETAGGIITDTPITSSAQLIETLRNGTYALHCSGTAAALDGMADMPAKYEKERT